MNPAYQWPYGNEERQRDSVGSPPVSTAVQITAAWLIAFTCIGLLALLS